MLAITPFERPDVRLAAAVVRSGAVGVLDLGRDRAAGLDALARLREAVGRRGFGVRVPPGAPFTADDVDSAATTIVLPPGMMIAPWRASSSTRKIYVQVTNVADAKVAITSGADGLIAKGNESGGEVDDESAFVLMQRLLAEFGPECAIWVQGGIGLHTAAACVAGGARGVVLDSQLALLDESTLPQRVRALLQTLDGSETTVVAGHRILARPGIAAPPPEVSPEELRKLLGANDPSKELLPAGQDVALAKPLAERFKTVGNLIAAVRRNITGHMRLARELDPLGEGAPLARELGSRYPITQGPMARVSDVPAFAEAVSTAGALPFVALSVARGAEARELLTSVKQAHDGTGNGWGVGILGFMDPEFVEEQAALLRELAPSVVLIGGGRPAQAQAFEDAGIRAFLHVPSPGLLDLFLAEGARRFVVEGRESGGHIGPRSSFVLWEQTIERLLAEPHVGETSVLFAGGIHDARSAAMVATAAAPLAARGAKVGVQLGTAYLFTEEAVTTGAILPEYQQIALECDRTTVLETLAGHATRCVPTEYVQFFGSERRRLESEGKESREVWAALEELNLGRLRIAAKGIAKDGTERDGAARKREGMFMIGEVAALWRRTCKMEELHRDVSEGSWRMLTATVPEQPPGKPLDVAIVGMASIFPGAPDLASYWRNIVSGTKSVTEVPRERWNPDVYYDPKGTGDKTPSRWGAFLDETPFDPASYGIPPRSVAAIEPIQLLALETARRALEDSGYATREFDRERTSVIFAASSTGDLGGGYGLRAIYPKYLGEMPKELDGVLPRLTDDSFAGILSNVIAGRVANRLDLGGVNYTVDAACASSLAALDLACKELDAGASDLVLCGGADLHNSIGDYLMFASVHAMTGGSECRPFDASADGLILGEGIGVIVLKRLADAQRDGDRIYAVIKGVGGSSDGKSLGLTAPRQEGQIRAMERAYAKAGISPADVELVEAHGTGTVVGDRTELATLTEVFAGSGAMPGHVTLGSIKGQIGHTKCAAGIAGIIKATLAIHHGVLPPTVNIKTPNPGYEGARSPFVFRNAAHPWPSRRRLAGVSAFGFGGSNFHVVLASCDDQPTPASGLAEWRAELFLFRGATLADAQQSCADLEKLARSGKRYRLRDLAAGAAARGSGPVQIAFVAEGLEDLASRCRTAQEGKGAGVQFATSCPEGVRGGALAMLFPGQGSQRTGMLADLFTAFPELQELVRLGQPWADRIFPRAAFTPKEQATQSAALTDTRVAQPALGIADLAMARLLAKVGISGAMMGGHSYGELAALAVAGTIDPAVLLRLSEARARCILDAARGAPGTMAAVRGSAEAIVKALPPDSGVTLANLNAPDQVVIAGPDAAVEAACKRLEEAGLSSRKIPVACAFHSPVVAAGAVTFAAELEKVTIREPSRTVFANSTAAPYPSDPAAIRELLAGQIARPVRFAEQVEAMYAAGARIFVEAGPGGVLTNLVQRILGERPHLAVACDQSGEPGIRSFLQALAALATAGVDLDPAPLFQGRDVNPIDPASPPSLDLPATCWMVNGYKAWPVKGELPAFAMKPVSAPVATASLAAHPSALAGDREATVLEYLTSMRELVESQRQVMLRFLGDDAPATGLPAPRSAASARPSAMAVAVAAAPIIEALPVIIESAMDALLTILSDRTGYPKDLLEPDLDIEANLGIDSIKRMEVLGALAERLGLAMSEGRKRSELIERLASVKTLRGIAEAFEAVRPPAPKPAAQPVNGATAAARPAESPMEALLTILSDRTGYPKDLLEPDLDIEANLGIDSIKRMEVLGALAERLGLATTDGRKRSELIERLASVKTLRGIAEAFGEPRAEESTPAAPSAPAVAPAPATTPASTAQIANAEIILSRYLVNVEPIPPANPNGQQLTGRTFALTDDGRGVAPALIELLKQRGASAQILAPTDDGPAQVFDGLVHLAPLAATPEKDPRKALFGLAKQAALSGASWLIAATDLGGNFGKRNGSQVKEHSMGIGGMLRTVALEYPSLKVRAVDLDPTDPVDRTASALLTEILSDAPCVEVGYHDGVRYGQRVVQAPIEPGARTPLTLDEKSVVLLTGGARGITAAAAIELAKRFHCSLELVDRAPLPGPEDADLAACADGPAVRRVLLERAGRSGSKPNLTAIEKDLAGILNARLVRATLAELEKEVGSRVRYNVCDVRDGQAFGALLDDVYARHGRLDGVVHGAGVIEDKLLRDKTAESFARVFETKVNAALTLLAKLRADVKFVVFFSSVAGVYGNQGQIDYAAANDALDKIAHELQRRVDGKVISINWGPWAGTGMLSPELEREYARRGIGLIALAEGIQSLLTEVIHGAATQVIWMQADPKTLVGHPGQNARAASKEGV